MRRPSYKLFKDWGFEDLLRGILLLAGSTQTRLTRKQILDLLMRQVKWYQWTSFLDRCEDRDTPKDLPYTYKEDHVYKCLEWFVDRAITHLRQRGVIAKGKPLRLSLFGDTYERT